MELGCFLFACTVEHDDVRGVHQDKVTARIPTKSAARREACVAWLKTARCDAVEQFNPPAFGPKAGGYREPTPCDGLLDAVDPSAAGAGEGAQCTVDACAPGLDCAPAQVNRATATLRCEACRARPGEGAACGTDGGCATGLVCQSTLTTRTCVPPFAEGAACTSAAQCASGACDAVTRQCAPRKAEGAGCQRGDECASGVCDLSARVCGPGCRSSADCPAGEWCNAVSHRCNGPGAEGDMCSAHAHCQSGHCDSEGHCRSAPPAEPACGSTGKVCRPPSECRGGECLPMRLGCRPPGVGESCRALGVCDGLSTCDAQTQLCVHLPFEEGEPCSGRCANGLACIGGDAGTCRMPLPLFSECARSGECEAGATCELEERAGTRICARPPVGTPCATANECPPELYCNSELRCALRGAEGEACNVNAPCLASLYCEAGTVCRARKDAGETCGPFVGCQSGLRCGDGGSCEPAAAANVACSTGESGKCLPGLYCDTFAASPACAAQLGEGQACSRDAQCPSGKCEPSFGCLASAACVLEP